MANTTTLTPKSSSAVTASSLTSTRLMGLIAEGFMASAVLRRRHSEEPFDFAQDKLRDEESAFYVKADPSRSLPSSAAKGSGWQRSRRHFCSLAGMNHSSANEKNL